MRKRTSLFLLAGLTLPVVTCVVACQSKAKSADAQADEIPSARVAAAARGNVAHTLSLAGQFQPYQVVDVHPKVTGFMVKINVDIGDRVHTGQTLAVLEVPELNAQLKGTGFEMQQAQDDLQRTQHEIKRAEATHSALHADYQRLLETSKAQPGLVAQQELDDAQSKDLSSESQVDAAKAAADAAREHTEVANADNERVQALKNLALSLAQTRYRLGLSSIVELSQAQYQQTDAAIGNTNAEYQYRLALATLNYQIGATP